MVSRNVPPPGSGSQLSWQPLQNRIPPAAAWRALRDPLAEVLHQSSTGRHLAAAGYGSDVDVAAAHDAQDTVPVLLDGAFRTIGQ